MINQFVELKTSSVLLEALHKALLKKPTREERFEQRVSYVFAELGAENSYTRDQVRELLMERG